MTQDQITVCLSVIGVTNIQFVDQATYQAAIQALQPKF